MNRFVSRQIPFACWLLAACGAASGGAAPPDKMAYWGTPRQGANFFNEVESAERFAAARQAGIQFVRLAPNKWLNGRPAAERGDFLLGRPGKFTALHPGDLARLRQVLDDAEAAKIKIVLTMLSLPGSRWKQHNEGVQEVALWQDFSRQAEAVECWRQLAVALRSHPAVVGYDVLNEPAPERVKPRLADWFTGDAEAWAATVRDTPADLSLFYEKLVAAVREADPVTPIILESGFYATPWAFKTLRPVRDDRVLYSFHFYEPYAFTNHRNDGRFDYPGRIPTGESDAVRAIDWNREQMRAFFEPVRAWQKKFNVPPARILAGEFGVTRTHPGAAQYLDDAMAVFDAHGWHWAFYAYREDGWTAMDYELGTDKPSPAYRQAIEAGRMPGADVYRGSALFEVIRKRLRAGP